MDEYLDDKMVICWECQKVQWTDVFGTYDSNDGIKFWISDGSVDGPLE